MRGTTKIALLTALLLAIAGCGEAARAAGGFFDAGVEAAERERVTQLVHRVRNKNAKAGYKRTEPIIGGWDRARAGGGASCLGWGGVPACSSWMSRRQPQPHPHRTPPGTAPACRHPHPALQRLPREVLYCSILC
jgi:hypothetical protein